MADTIKVRSSEITLSNTTPNTVSSASLVRIINADTANNVVITLANSTVTIGTLTLGYNTTTFSSVNLMKQPADTIVFTGTSPNIKASSIGYF